MQTNTDNRTVTCSRIEYTSETALKSPTQTRENVDSLGAKVASLFSGDDGGNARFLSGFDTFGRRTSRDFGTKICAFSSSGRSKTSANTLAMPERAAGREGISESALDETSIILGRDELVLLLPKLVCEALAKSNIAGANGAVCFEAPTESWASSQATRNGFPSTLATSGTGQER